MGRYFFLFLILCGAIPSAALAERNLVWNSTPITLVIPVGEEIRVTFPTEVLLQVPATLTSSLESLAPNQQIVYWRATAPFDAARVVAQSVDNQTVYLIDLVAQPGASKEPVMIEDANRILAAHNEAEGSSTRYEPQELLDPPEIILTRFASQTLYAPQRLLPQNDSISALADVRLATDFPLIRSQSGEQYAVSVVGAWSGFGRYVTAVLVVNQSQLRIEVNPGLVQGNFTHITPQHLFIGPKGSLEDRTTLYLISAVPFNAAILEDGYGW